MAVENIHSVAVGEVYHIGKSPAKFVCTQLIPKPHFESHALGSAIDLDLETVLKTDILKPVEPFKQ
jgi:hypothetical protein